MKKTLKELNVPVNYKGKMITPKAYVNDQLKKDFTDWDVTINTDVNNELVLEFELDDAQYETVPFVMFETVKRLLKEFDFDIK